MARLVCRVRNDGTTDIDIVEVNDGDEVSPAEALIILLKGVSFHLGTISRRLEDLR